MNNAETTQARRRSTHRVTSVRAMAVLLALGLVGCSSPRELSIVFVDVNGGAAKLMVTPRGETILVDCGSPGDRDADRIAAALDDATGRRRIDHMVSTHWHLDHYGGIEPLAERVEIRRFYDRGIPEQTLDDPKNFPRLMAAYRRTIDGKPRSILRAGGDIPLAQVADGPPIALRCLMASGKPQKSVRDEYAAKEVVNTHCDAHAPKSPDTGENGQSIVLLLEYGAFEFLNAGDLTWNLERDFVCPTNPFGTVDLMQVPHHGLSASSNPVFIHAVRPTVAVCCNAPRKGAAVEVYQTFLTSPGFVDYWQLHRNARLEDDEQTPERFIANAANPEGGTNLIARVDRQATAFHIAIAGASDEVKRYPVR